MKITLIGRLPNLCKNIEHPQGHMMHGHRSLLQTRAISGNFCDFKLLLH